MGSADLLGRNTPRLRASSAAADRLGATPLFGIVENPRGLRINATFGKRPSWIPAFAGMTYRKDNDVDEIVPYSKWLSQQSLLEGIKTSMRQP